MILYRLLLPIPQDLLYRKTKYMQMYVLLYNLFTMNNYVNLVKSWYQTGQEYISTYTESTKKKAAFVKIDKAATIYDARAFHNTQLETPKCIRTLTNLIYLFNQGEHFSEEEGTQLFFAITKLLQSEDASLRRVVYVSVK